MTSVRTPFDELGEGLLFDPKRGFNNGKQGERQAFQIGGWTNPIEYYVAGGYNIDDGAGFSWASAGEGAARRVRYPLEIRRAAATLSYGDAAWRNYTVSVRLTPETGVDYSGLAFRYVHSRCYYALLLGRGERLTLVRRMHEEWTVLAERVIAGPAAGRERCLEVTLRGSDIVCRLDGEEAYSVTDDAYPAGGVALVTYSPASYGELRLALDPGEGEAAAERARLAAEALAAKRARFVSPVLARTAPIPAGVAGNFRLVEAAQRLVFVQAQHCSPLPGVGNVYEKITCVTVMDLDGRVCWQRGTPRPGDIGSSCFQVCDLDGDGELELLIAIDFEILLLDFATGEVKRRCPTPLAPKLAVPFTDGPEDYYPRILGDNLFAFASTGDGGLDRFLIKDRYNNVWCYDSDMKPLWHMSFITGHFPTSFDLDGDGREEILLGHRCIAGDGRIMWMLPLGDHVDNIAAGRYAGEDGELLVYYAAGEEGFVVADARGRIVRQQKLGHVQSFCVAPFSKALGGLQFVVRTLWGDQGLIYAMDAAGNVLKTIQRGHGITLRALDWLGDGTATLLFQSAEQPSPVFLDFELDEIGGFPDLDPSVKYSLAIVRLPGDGREQVILRGGGELRFYVQRDAGREGVTPLTRTLGGTNVSVYQPDCLR